MRMHSAAVTMMTMATTTATTGESKRGEGMNTEVSGVRSTWHNLHSSNAPRSDVGVAVQRTIRVHFPPPTARKCHPHRTEPFPMQTSRSMLTRHSFEQTACKSPANTQSPSSQKSHAVRQRVTQGRPSKRPNRQSSSRTTRQAQQSHLS